MQPQKQLVLNLKPGAPASAVPRSWFNFVNNVLRFLSIENGVLITNNDKWTIRCIGTGGGQWSGRIFFGGELVTEIDPRTWTNTHVKINLRDGQISGEDWDENDISAIDEHEYYSVMDKALDDEGNPVYNLNNHTCGDIHCRVI